MNIGPWEGGLAHGSNGPRQAPHGAWHGLSTPGLGAFPGTGKQPRMAVTIHF